MIPRRCETCAYYFKGQCKVTLKMISEIRGNFTDSCPFYKERLVIK